MCGCDLNCALISWSLSDRSLFQEKLRTRAQAELRPRAHLLLSLLSSPRTSREEKSAVGSAMGPKNCHRQLATVSGGSRETSRDKRRNKTVCKTGILNQVAQALGRQRQEDCCRGETSLSYIEGSMATVATH